VQLRQDHFLCTVFSIILQIETEFSQHFGLTLIKMSHLSHLKTYFLRQNFCLMTY